MKKLNCTLLIDDNPGDNYLLSYLIRESAVSKHIKTVTNGYEALYYLSKSAEKGMEEHYPRPELIFLDINMPGLDGFGFLREYGKLNIDIKFNTEIVMLTSSNDPLEKKKALDTGYVCEFVTKPLEPEDFFSLLDRFF